MMTRTESHHLQRGEYLCSYFFFFSLYCVDESVRPCYANSVGAGSVLRPPCVTQRRSGASWFRPLARRERRQTGSEASKTWTSHLLASFLPSRRLITFSSASESVSFGVKTSFPATLSFLLYLLLSVLFCKARSCESNEASTD